MSNANEGIVVSLDTIYNSLKGKMNAGLTEKDAIAVENFLLQLLELCSRIVSNCM